MNNLAQNQIEAKQACLNDERKGLLEIYRASTKNERAAVIRHIDSFLPTISQAEKIFWLKVRRDLERISETTLPI